MSNVEESHLLSPKQPDGGSDVGSSVVLQETMMNSLPVAGMFAIPAHERERFEKKSMQSPGTPTLSANNSSVFNARGQGSNNNLVAFAIANTQQGEQQLNHRMNSFAGDGLTDLNEEQSREEFSRDNINRSATSEKKGF